MLKRLSIFIFIRNFYFYLTSFFMKKIFFLVFLLGFSKSLFAQSKCDLVKNLENDKSFTEAPNTFYKKFYEEIDEAYEKGDLGCVIEAFEKFCLIQKKGGNVLKKEFTKLNEILRANIYEIIVYAYLTLDEEEAAEKYLLHLFALRNEEEFEDYWFEVRKSKEEHFIAPQLLYGVGFGINSSIVEPFQRYNIFEALQSPQPNWYNYDYFNFSESFRKSLNWQFNLNVDYSFSRNFAAHVQVAYDRKTYGYYSNQKWTHQTKFTVSGSENIVENIVEQENKHLQNLDYLGLKLLFKYQPANNSLRPTASIGGFYGAFMGGTKIIEITELPGIVDNGVRTNFTARTFEYTIDIRNLISKVNYGVIASIGLNYNFKKFQISADLNYLHGLSNIVKAENRFDNTNLILDFYDILDDVKFRSLEFIVRTSYPVFYKAFKKTKKQPRP
ncbi:MAG: hypothetical protein EAZ97_10040 [Bacteroidetes bacterium]|nr:MAG: hypothetical protein EAZ97_10040 [Bacteroidota bacterium]